MTINEVNVLMHNIIHLHQVTMQDIMHLSKFTKVQYELTHLNHIREVSLQLRIEVYPSLLQVLDSLPQCKLVCALKRAIDDRQPYVYVT